jgi:hypothetical protein
VRSTSRFSLIAGALLGASGQPLLPADPIPRERGKPIVKNRERLTKAEKKRARKAAQRARLAARATVGERNDA